MENRIAIIGIIVENPDSVKRLNQAAAEYSDYSPVGHMGIRTQTATSILSALRLKRRRTR